MVTWERKYSNDSELLYAGIFPDSLVSSTAQAR